MTSRRILATVLMLIALAGVAVFVGRLLWTGTPVQEEPGVRPPARPDAAVMLYLHGNVRCVTCNQMEAWTEAAIRSTYAAELAEGLVEFRKVNFEAPGRSFFSRDYHIVAASVLLIKFQSGLPVRWERLDRIWEFSGTPSAFTAYVQRSTRRFLDGEAGQTSVDRSFMWMLALAFGLGLLSAISPCPLATHVAAVSFLSRNASTPRQVLLQGLAYALGRTLVYVALGAFLVAGLLSAPGLKDILNTCVNGLLGSLLIVAGIFLLELAPVALGLGRLISAEQLRSRAERGGLWSALAIGMLFALAFCPTTLAFFFGGLIPLAVTSGAWLLAPMAYGLATGLPVLLFAVLLALAAHAVGRWFGALSRVDFWMRRIAGLTFIVLGVYYSVLYLLSGVV